MAASRVECEHGVCGGPGRGQGRSVGEGLDQERGRVEGQGLELFQPSTEKVKNRV